MSRLGGWIGSIAGGALLWSAIALAHGGREPWDVPQYWSVYWPAAILLAFVLGFAFPRGAWKWSLAVMLMQVPVMLASGSDASLLPLGVILLAILALPGMLAGLVGAGLRRWLTGADAA